jgi:hypothetical protein
MASVAMQAQGQEPVAATLAYTVSTDALGCPAEAAVRGAVAARLGYTPFDRPQPAFSVRVAVRRERSELVGELSITRIAGQTNEDPAAAPRVLRAAEDRCEELLASISSNMALSLDPSALYAAPAPSPPLAARKPICPAPLPCPICLDPELREPQTPHATLLQFDAALGGGVTAQALPAAVAHAQLEFGVRYAGFRAAIGGVVTATAAGDRGSEIAAQLNYGAVSLCMVQDLDRARFNLAACALGSIGALTASRPELGLQSTRVTSALGGRAQAELTLFSQTFLRLSIDGQAALTRHVFEIGAAARWSSPAFWFGGQLAWGVRFS